MCDEDSFETGASRLSPACDEPDIQTLLGFFDTAARAEALTRGSNLRSNGFWWIQTFCCEFIEHPAQQDIYRLSDLDIASRLSFFLWSSIPDDRLLDLAERRELTSPPR